MALASQLFGSAHSGASESGKDFVWRVRAGSSPRKDASKFKAQGTTNFGRVIRFGGYFAVQLRSTLVHTPGHEHS